ncbi:MAG: hypothetical protein II338_04915, partial [Bacteroidaceae bacterium]|nr:hypothetical protein [Bacteroidaceae bacterium]
MITKLMQGQAQNKANTIRQLICHPIAQLIAAKLVIFSVLAQTLYFHILDYLIYSFKIVHAILIVGYTHGKKSADIF